MVIAIIVARGGSTEFPRKNIALLNGKPLINYTIEHGLSAELVDRVIVSTDDAEIAQISRDAGADVPFIRPSYLGRGEVMWPMLLQHAVSQIEEIDIVVGLQPTFPFRDDTLIDCAIAKVLQNPDIDGCLTMLKNHNTPWIYKDGSYKNLVSGITESRPRQDRQPLYDLCYGLGSAVRPHLIRDGMHIPEKFDIVVPEDPACSIDINTQFDLDIASLVFKSRETDSRSVDLLEG